MVKIQENPEQDSLPEIKNTRSSQNEPTLFNLEAGDILCKVENTMRLNLEEDPNMLKAYMHKRLAT